MDEILLPTMMWSKSDKQYFRYYHALCSFPNHPSPATTYKAAKDEKRFFPVPMSTLFDVDHWNSFSGHLPLLVDSIDDSDCWEEHTVTDSTENIYERKSSPPSAFVTPMAREILESSALLTPVKNISHQILTGSLHVQTRKLDLLGQVENCSRPMVYGGGRGAGRLWNDYVRMPKAQPGMNETDSRALESTELISVVSKALRPTSKWREVAHKCVKERQLGVAHPSNNSEAKTMRPYIALHARVEVDMMIHRCSKDMEKNLTSIFEMVESFKERNNNRFGEADLQGIFVAVSRHGMRQKTKEESVQTLLKENWIALNSSASRRSIFFECGEEMMRSWYSSQSDFEEDYYGSLLPSILNFYIATQAAVFIGVSKSSFSTDVWTTRYYQGKGASNFEYTRNGVSPIPNGGLPPPHGNC